MRLKIESPCASSAPWTLKSVSSSPARADVIPERFELHNFDVLLNGLEIKAHVYRYFFTPPQAADHAVLQQIVDASGRADFQVPRAPAVTMAPV